MEQDDPAEALTELRERQLSALELLQVAAGSSLAAYAVWALLLHPGFRRVPLRLQVTGGTHVDGWDSWRGGAHGGTGSGPSRARSFWQGLAGRGCRSCGTAL